MTSGPVRATLKGINHSPRAGKNWYYTLRVSGASGHPLTGTVDVRFVLGELVVGHDTPRVHRLRNGVLHEELTFPAEAIGHGIALQTVVHTSAGSVTLNWPVNVVR